MTLRQRILKWTYPFFVQFKKIRGESKGISIPKEINAPASFYKLSVILNNGDALPFELFHGKKVLIVNTASNCGFTNQYSELQQVYQQHKESLVVLGFPSNDFKEQEKGTDEQIANFCQVNFGVSFPLTKKSVVVKGSDQNKVFEWLSHKELNGWNEQQPIWNFCKYLVNENGSLTHYFDPAVSPLSAEVIKAIN